jgi:hypothetical protein
MEGEDDETNQLQVRALILHYLDASAKKIEGGTC